MCIRDRAIPRRRELVIFDKGWRRMSEVQLPTSMRSRGGTDEAVFYVLVLPVRPQVPAVRQHAVVG
eukprot:543244-Alexandrium_andersonii.AAC.1